MRVCLVSSGMEERNRPLQPWRYLFETAGALTRSGHEVCLVSNGHPRLPEQGDIEGLPVVRLASLRDWPGRRNAPLVEALTSLRPDVVIWHLGLTSFLHLRALKHISAPVIGAFTSPIYRPRELLRLGLPRLLHGPSLTALHLLGLFVPGALIRRAFDQDLIGQMVVECETTRTRLLKRGAPDNRVQVIRPTIDPAWFETSVTPVVREHIRNHLKFPPDSFIVGYFGPPATLRGLPTLIKAGAVTREKGLNVRLLALSRQHHGEQRGARRTLERLMTRLEATTWTHIITGFLPQEQLIQTVAACDVIALPFEIIPSDVPVSVLETLALGMPLIVTQVACLPELVPEGTGLRVPAADPLALAEAICALAADAALRQELGSKGREHAISWSVQSQDHKKWDTLLKQQTRSG